MNTEEGESGVTPGSDGFVAAVDAETPGVGDVNGDEIFHFNINPLIKQLIINCIKKTGTTILIIHSAPSYIFTFDRTRTLKESRQYKTAPAIPYSITVSRYGYEVHTL